MATKEEAIAAFETAYAEFRAKLDALDDKAWDETWLGAWKTEHLLAHMAGWAHEMTGGLERVKAGQRPTPEGVSYTDTDGWNAKFASTASPGKAAIASFELAVKQYLAAARALPDDSFGEGENGKPKIGNRLLDGGGTHHFGEHGAELDAWLASRSKEQAKIGN